MGVPRKLKLLQKTAKTPSKEVSAEQRHRLRERIRVMEAASNPIIITDSNNQIVFINSRAEVFLGYDDTDLVGLCLDEYFQFTGGSGTQRRYGKPGGRDRSESLSRLAGERGDGSAFDITVISHRVDVEQEQLRVLTLDTSGSSGVAAEDQAVPRTIYDAIIHGSPLGYHSLDAEGNILKVNRTWLDSLGYHESEVIGRWFGDFLSEKYVRLFERSFPRLKKLGQFRDVELEMVAKDGSIVVAAFECRAAYDGSGRFAQTHCIFHDISDRKRAEKKAQESAERFRLLAEVSPDGICVHRDGKIVFMNPSGARLLGADNPETLIGREIGEFVVPEDREMVETRLRELMQSRRPLPFVEQNLLRLDGSTVEVEITSVALTYEGDDAVQVVARDITERKRTEEALRVSEDLYRTTIDSMADMVHVVDRDLIFNLVNTRFREWCEELGLSGDVKGCSVFDAFPFLPQEVRDEYHRVFETGQMLVTEESNFVGGKEIITETRKIPVSEAEEVTNVITVVRDITERKLSEKALKDSEERFRTMADFTYDWEYWLGTDGKCIYVSPSIESMTGYSASEFENDVGLLRRITHPEDLKILDSHLTDESTEGRVTSIDFRIIRRDGEERWINHVCQPVFSSEDVYLGHRASNRDITDRKRAEEALRRERDRAQLYLDVAGTVLLAINQDERVVLINRKGCELLGCEELEVIGLNWFDHYVPPGVREQTRSVFRSLMAGDTDGTQYAESRVLTASRDERLIAWYNTVVRDEEGNIRGTLSSGLDITERQHMEKVQSALFEISEATNLAGSLEDLLGTIHRILGKLIDTTNFYVALYDAQQDCYTFPYLVDQYHKSADLEPEQLKRTLTDYVRRTGQSLLADEKKDTELQARGEVAVVGQPSKIWLGVPLTTSQGVIGVVAVQSYVDGALYQERDMDLMTFVSRHISMAVERKLAEEALRESEEHYRTLVHTMNEGLAVRNNNNVVLFANQRFCQMLGYSSREVVGANVFHFLDDDNRKILSAQSLERLAGASEPYELEWTRRDGARVTTIMSPVVRRDASGAVVGSIAVITDISERKRSEDKLRQATELLRTEREALTQKNIALKEILDHIEKERQDYKQAICRDVSQAIEPLMTKLKKLANGEKARDIESLESQLDALLAKDVDVFRDRYTRLSPRELEICDLIKGKMSSKEISERLNVSLLTVHKHREQIRRKLGITSKGINLSAYLQSH